MARPRVLAMPAGVACEYIDQGWGPDGQISLGGKNDRRAGFCTHGGNLGIRRDNHIDGLRGGEIKRDRSGRRAWPLQPHPYQFQEFDVVLIGYLVDTVQQHIRHPGKEFDQRYTWIADIMIGPFPAIARDEQLRLVHDILKMAIVECWGW